MMRTELPRQSPELQQSPQGNQDTDNQLSNPLIPEEEEVEVVSEHSHIKDKWKMRKDYDSSSESKTKVLLMKI